MRALVDQRGIAIQRLSAALDFEQLGQLAERPCGQPLMWRNLGRRVAFGHGLLARPFAACATIRRCLFGRLQHAACGDLLERLLRLLTEFAAQLRQIAPHAELPAMLVDHLEIHEQMGWQGFQLEVRCLQHYAGLFAYVGDQRIEQRAQAERRARDEARSIVG